MLLLLLMHCWFVYISGTIPYTLGLPAICRSCTQPRPTDHNFRLIDGLIANIKSKETSVRDRKLWYNVTVRQLTDENTTMLHKANQSGAAEVWWAHNPQVPGSKPGSDKLKRKLTLLFF
ncbi:hypothetical protein V6N11_053890 [Hibiscus sabdariffa]|uniref:Secreted protein n=1 Tax=Hibiscus sabdariffa TaxID=183260 RepID=A0ABR2S283_9ROSI